MIYISAGHSGLGTGSHGLIDEAAEAIRMRNGITAELLRLGVPDSQICNDHDQAPLSKVINDVNAKCTNTKRDIAIELHFNCNGIDKTANGTETIVADKHSEKSEKIAIDLNQTIVRTLGTRDRTPKGRGYKTEKDSAHKTLGFLRKVNCPSVIAEICFVKNKEDVESYKAKRDELCTELAKTIMKWHE